MNLPDSVPHSIECPSCSNSIANLEWQKDNWGFDYLVYTCYFCKEGWTTNESDEISKRSRQIKKRSLVRKDKIKKLDGL